jgi:glucokinase
MKIIGVDIGGTKISAGLISDNKIIKLEKIATPFDQPKLDVVNAVTSAIDMVYDDEVIGIGIGVPGLVDLNENLVIDVMNIPSWDKVPLAELISGHFNKPVYVNNDANCFAIGEKYFGKGKPYSNFVGVTIGTGLGAGIIINGHLYSGQFCGAGEFGTIYYKDSTIESYSSGQFFKDKGLNGFDLAQKASKEDNESLKYFDELGVHIGKAIANILFALAPEAIILGGSVIESYPYFENGMKNYFKNEFPYQRLYKALKIEVSNIENMAILGASSLVLDAT